MIHCFSIQDLGNSTSSSLGLVVPNFRVKYNPDSPESWNRTSGPVLKHSLYVGTLTSIMCWNTSYTPFVFSYILSSRQYFILLSTLYCSLKKYAGRNIYAHTSALLYEVISKTAFPLMSVDCEEKDMKTT